MPSVRVTTDPGIEDVAIAEVTRLLGEAGITVSQTQEQPEGLRGVVMVDLQTDQPAELQTIQHVAFDADDGTALCNRVWEALSRARSIYHVVVHIGEVEWKGQPLGELAAEIAALPFARMAHSGSFRATCSRIGEHPFQSPDVEAAVGTALQSRYGTAVDLEHYDVNVRVDIVGTRCLCGYQLTGKKGLDRRHRWQYHPRVTLRTTIAHAMLQIVGFGTNPGDLHDPFCGSGTILLEAAALRPPGAGVSIAGSDRAVRAVEGCRSNLEAAGLSGEVSVRRMDVRGLSSHLPAAGLDYIVTNPPFGIRMATDTDLGALYRHLLNEAAVVLRPGGVLALLVGRRGRFNSTLQSTEGFRLEHVRIIEVGGVYPGLFVLRRAARQ